MKQRGWLKKKNNDCFWMENIFVWRVTHICVHVTQAQILLTSSKHVLLGMHFWGSVRGFVSPKLHVSTHRNQQHCWWFHYRTVCGDCCANNMYFWMQASTVRSSGRCVIFIWKNMNCKWILVFYVNVDNLIDIIPIISSCLALAVKHIELSVVIVVQICISMHVKTATPACSCFIETNK